MAWISSDADGCFVSQPGYAPIRRDVITNGRITSSYLIFQKGMECVAHCPLIDLAIGIADYQLFKTKLDKTDYAEAETYAL